MRARPPRPSKSPAIREESLKCRTAKFDFRQHPFRTSQTTTHRHYSEAQQSRGPQAIKDKATRENRRDMNHSTGLDCRSMPHLYFPGGINPTHVVNISNFCMRPPRRTTHPAGPKSQCRRETTFWRIGAFLNTASLRLLRPTDFPFFVFGLAYRRDIVIEKHGSCGRHDRNHRTRCSRLAQCAHTLDRRSLRIR